MASALDERLVEFFSKQLESLQELEPKEISKTMASMLKAITQKIDATERMNSMPFWLQQIHARYHEPVVFWTEHLYHAMLVAPISCAKVLYDAEGLDRNMHLRRVAYLYVSRALSTEISGAAPAAP